MEDGLIRNDNGNWVAPLLFRDDVKLPDNRLLTINHLKSFCKFLDKKPAIKQQYMDFIAKLFSKRHAEPLEPGTEAKWP